MTSKTLACYNFDMNADLRLVISCFAGLGKTTVAKKYPNVCDLQTSAFRRNPSIKTYDYEKQKGFDSNITNPNFPQNYLDALENARTKYEIVLVTMAHDIRELLEQNNIPFIFVLPERTNSFKEKLIARCQERGNSESFVKYISENFDSLSRNQKDYKNKILILKENQYLEDLLLEEKILLAIGVGSGGRI